MRSSTNPAGRYSVMTARLVALFVVGTMLLAGCSSGASTVASTPTVPSVPATVAAAASPTATATPIPSLVSQSPQASTVSAIPDGDYQTGHITAAMMTAALKAAGLGDQAPGIIAATGFRQYMTFTVRLRAGKYVQFQAVDGGPTEAGSLGTIVSTTSDTMVLQEIQAGSPVGAQQTYMFKWDGERLGLDLISGPPGDDFAILTAIYESSPFTRNP
jgi:hypothetical protein